jgi:methionine synthase II (cobalamin-independent)
MAKGLRTTVVGSWWPLAEFANDLKRFHAGRLSPEDSRAVLDNVAAKAIEEQRALGFTEWTGGEYFAFQFIEHLQRHLSGIEIVTPTQPEVFDYDDVAVARIVGELRVKGALGYADAFRRECRLQGGVTKATVVGPGELAMNLLGDFPALRPHIPTLIRSINREIRELEDVGCQHIQLDVPTCAALITNDVMTVDETAEMIAGCFEGVKKSRRGIHICSGNLCGRPLAANLSSAPWAEILSRLDGVIDVAHLALHYFNRYLERDLFRHIPRSIELAAGIVDEASYGIESVAKIRERAQAWAAVVGEERLWLAPSCGFGRHPLRSVPVLRQKLENMMEAASAF